MSYPTTIRILAMIQFSLILFFWVGLGLLGRYDGHEWFPLGVYDSTGLTYFYDGKGIPSDEVEFSLSEIFLSALLFSHLLSILLLLLMRTWVFWLYGVSGTLLIFVVLAAITFDLSFVDTTPYSVVLDLVGAVVDALFCITIFVILKMFGFFQMDRKGG